MLAAFGGGTYNLKEGFVRGSFEKRLHMGGEKRQNYHEWTDVGRSGDTMPHSNQIQDIGVAQLAMCYCFSAHLLCFLSKFVLPACIGEQHTFKIVWPSSELHRP